MGKNGLVARAHWSALSNQGRYADAARSYIRATRLCPADSRALAFLDDLFAGHKEIIEEIPDLPAQLHECHELVQGADGDTGLDFLGGASRASHEG